MRFACLLVEHLPIRVEVWLQPTLAQQAIVILRAWDGNVLDASPEATMAGVGSGDSRRRVEQLCPHALILSGQESLYQSYHDRLKSVAAAFAPAVETGSLGELYIEIGALTRSFPSEKALALTLATQADQATHLQPTVGVAANKFTAFQAARQAANENSHVLTVSQGSERNFLAPLPLTVLPLTALPDRRVELFRRLSLFGINTLGGFGTLPHPAIVLQFGQEVAVYHDLARGIDPRPLEVQAPPPSVIHQKTLPDPLLDRGQVLTVLERLAGRVSNTLSASGHHAMALSLVVKTADGQTHNVGTLLKPPSADVQFLRRTVGRLLGKLTLAAGVTELVVTASPLREWHLSTRQLTLLERPAQARVERLLTALDQLRKQFGEWIVKLASVVGPPLPVPIRVRIGPGNRPASMAWGGWSRQVVSVYEYWRECRNRWDTPVVHDYFQVEIVGELIFTIFRDSSDRWFLDRRRS